MTSSHPKVEFGDFQTPAPLAAQICRILVSRGVKPSCIIEPNCGEGSFILACLENFQGHPEILGFDVNARYVNTLRRSLGMRTGSSRVKIHCRDFYEADWTGVLQPLKEPLLIVGNPPWVTNAGLGALGGMNLPQKSNFQGHPGIDAITGKSNFDISEWMLIQESEWLNGKTGTLAMLCKTAVARKVLLHAWKNRMQISKSDIYQIDATRTFGVAVSACLLICEFVPGRHSTECFVRPSLDGEPDGVVGLRDGRLVADIKAYERWQFLRGSSEPYKWRSGIKHDCADVMELQRVGKLYRNTQGELLQLEGQYVYPMLKGSQLGNGRVTDCDRSMIVTQRFIGEDTTPIREKAPKTWEYLQRHAKKFHGRASSIYKGKPAFSIFGVGDYSFSDWKVGISALYKKLHFSVIGPIGGKPVILDDTCYFISCSKKKEAELICGMLNSEPAQAFYNSLIFWDAKRPVTIEILSCLDLYKLASELGLSAEMARDQPALPLAPAGRTL